MAQQKLSPADRARMFNQATRQNLQLIATKTGTESTVTQFEIPKARLLSRLFLLLTCTLTATHASTTAYAAHEDSPFKFIDKIAVDLNNGFAPISLSGEALYLYNIANRGAVNMALATSGRGSNVQPLVSSSGGTANSIKILAELPISINPRDAVGLLLLQNAETLCTVDVTIGAEADLAPAASGFTFAVSAISVSLLSETFSVPAIPEALPDLSVMKLVNERTETVAASENTFKLPVGLIYRKLGFILSNATPARVAEAGITGNIELILNQADVPYRIPAAALASMNFDQYGGALPGGSWIFDFSAMQGLRNLSGARDYIDTEGVTEFWLRFTSAAAGTVKIVTETLSKMQ